jgi:hypothetical protein
VKRTLVAVASMALPALTCMGCSATTPAGQGVSTKPASEPVASAARCAAAGPIAPAPSVRRSAAASWPWRLVARQKPAGLVSGQVINPTAGVSYTLISRTSTPMRGPYVLECTELRTRSVRKGFVFRGGNLTAVAGYLWVYGTPGPGWQPVISQVNPVTLARIRSIPLPPEQASFGGAAFAAGPGSSVWIGSYRTLLRVDASTGNALTRVTLPLGLAVGDIAVDSARTTLYVSAAHAMRDGTEGGLVMLEYDARSGRLLAAASSGLLRYSVAGAALTAVPGGVWASFRTGMLGLTIHLRRAGLWVIAPPGPGIAGRAATGIFHWAMNEATAYGGGALWLANLRIVACLDPRTGAVRASEQVGPSPKLANRVIYQFQAIDPARHAIYATSTDGLLQITPPRRCWS